MNFEEERLGVLQRVSNGELSPEQGRVEISLLRAESQAASKAPPPVIASAAPFTPPDIRQAPPALPWALGVLLPILVLGGPLLLMFALLLALPIGVLVSLWDSLGLRPTLSYFPTLGLATIGVIVWIFLGFRRQLRRLFPR